MSYEVYLAIKKSFVNRRLNFGKKKKITKMDYLRVNKP